METKKLQEIVKQVDKLVNEKGLLIPRGNICVYEEFRNTDYTSKGENFITHKGEFLAHYIITCKIKYKDDPEEDYGLAGYGFDFDEALKDFKTDLEDQWGAHNFQSDQIKQ